MRIATLLTPLLLAAPVWAYAQDSEATEPPAQTAEQQAAAQQAIARLTAAYGGENLISLRSVSIRGTRRLAWPGQGQTGLLVEYAENPISIHFDLQNLFGSSERWIDQNGGIYHTQMIVGPAGAFSIDHMEGTREPLEENGYWANFNAHYRGNDLLLAHFLATQSVDVTYEGIEGAGGHVNDVLSFMVAVGSPSAHVYISRKDGLIRRMLMKGPNRTVSFVFERHNQVQGIAFASESYAFVDDSLVEFIPRIDVSTNQDVSAAFDPAPELIESAGEVDQSEMTVQELTPGLYHVGQDDYSLFAREGDKLIAVNGDGGLKARYEALNEHLGETLPLSHVIMSHHHSDHTGGLADAAELGATVAMTKDTEVALTRADAMPEGLQKQLLSSDDTIGPFAIKVRATAHGAQNAFALHTASGALWQDDHYHGLLENRASRVQPSARDLHAIITKEGWDVRYMLSGHARKAEEWLAFDQAVRKSVPNLCPSGREICADKIG